MIFLLALLTFIIPLYSNASNEKVQINGIMYNLSSDRTAEVTYFGDDYLFLQNNYEGDVVIPKKVEYKGEWYGVTSLSEGAFYYSHGLKSISLPNNIIKIGDYAFSGCDNLKVVDLPNSVISLGSYAFTCCKNLSSLTIPDGIKTIGEGTFLGCDSLKSIIIPKSVENIGISSFEDCGSLERVELPQNIKSLGACVFKNCKNLKSLQLSGSFNQIGNEAFYGCIELEEITLPSTVFTIGEAAFEGDAMLNNVGLPANLVSLGNSVFKNCYKLSTINIPETTEAIGENAFSGCSNLVSITIPPKIKTIEDGTFYGCTNLVNVTFTEGLLSIGKLAFSDCRQIENVVFPEGLESILGAAFRYCSKLKNIQFPSTLSTIESEAFYGCMIESILAKASRVTAPKAFSDRTLAHAQLYVPTGKWADAVYNSDWYLFTNIKEVVFNRSELSSTRAYTLMRNDNFNYVIYDSFLEEVSLVYAFYNVDENSPYHSWQILQKNGEYYLYNIGSEKFVTIMDNGIFMLHDVETPIQINEIDNRLYLGAYKLTSWSFVPNENVKVAEMSSISMLNAPNNEIPTYYTISGTKAGYSHKGIIFTRTSDGKVRKSFVK